MFLSRCGEFRSGRDESASKSVRFFTRETFLNHLDDDVAVPIVAFSFVRRFLRHRRYLPRDPILTALLARSIIISRGGQNPLFLSAIFIEMYSRPVPGREVRFRLVIAANHVCPTARRFKIRPPTVFSTSLSRGLCLASTSRHLTSGDEPLNYPALPSPPPPSPRLPAVRASAAIKSQYSRCSGCTVCRVQYSLPPKSNFNRNLIRDLAQISRDFFRDDNVFASVRDHGRRDLSLIRELIVSTLFNRRS